MNLSKFDLTERIAIVTGGGRGIGKGICLALAQAGANIVVAELNPVTAEATAQEVQAMGTRSLAMPTDVCNLDQVELMVRKTLETFGTIDILVNNAGGVMQVQTVPASEMSEAIWNAIVDLNLKSVFLCSQAVAKVMVQQKKGNIVNISSVAAFNPYHPSLPYGASKAGVHNLTQTMATLLGPHNIRVNAVAPGSIITERAEENFKSHPGMAERRQKVVPLGRLGKPEDIAWVVVFLASDAATYVTGQVLSVDGAPPQSPEMVSNRQW